eukprot:2940298-Alexandrium_andersonii.AAC.1
MRRRPLEPDPGARLPPKTDSGTDKRPNRRTEKYISKRVQRRQGETGQGKGGQGTARKDPRKDTTGEDRTEQ